MYLYVHYSFYFTGEKYKKINRRPGENYEEMPSKRNENILKRRMRYEFELYNHIKEKLDKQYDALLS